MSRLRPTYLQPAGQKRHRAAMPGLRGFLAFFLTVLLGVASLPTGVDAQTNDAYIPVSASDQARLSQFEQALDNLRQQYRIPGLSAAIVNNQRIVWEKGFGFQDIENAVPATPDTPYRIASLTKTFSSMLLMRCVEQGTLDLNSPIRQYTTSITTNGVTVRHIFTHTSESTPPGEIYRYNGSRFAALTPVVDSCWGRPYRQVLAKNILDPLGMRDSVPGQDMESPSPEVAALFDQETLQRYSGVIQRLAKPYVINSSGQTVLSTYPNRGISASAGLISTVRDLARYDAAIDRHVMLRPETQEEAWTNAVSVQSHRTLPYALGWFVQNYHGERLVWHYGLWPTFSALILKVPGRNVTLILLANSDGLSAPFNSLGAGSVTGSPFAMLFLQMLDDPTAFTFNPIDDQREFVRQHYLDFLNREPDAPGWDFWTQNITRCGTDAQCIDRQRVTTSAAFFLSPEFQYTGYFVHRLYKGALGRAPKLSEFKPDQLIVGQNIIQNNQLSGAQIELNKKTLANQFVQRSEFKNIYDSLSNQQYVDRLFSTTGVPVSDSDRQALVDGLNSGGETRVTVLQKVVDGIVVISEGNQQFTTAYGEAFYRAEFDNAFVQMEYFGYMRRDPDEAGYQHWLQKLKFYGNYLDAEMVRSFIVSPEYRARFGQP